MGGPDGPCILACMALHRSFVSWALGTGMIFAKGWLVVICRRDAEASSGTILLLRI